MEIALLSVGLIIECDFGNSEKMYLPKKGVDISHIGEHLKQQPIFDENNNLIQDAIWDKSWHTNIRLNEPLTEEQKQKLPLIDPQPSTPSYIFG